MALGEKLKNGFALFLCLTSLLFLDFVYYAINTSVSDNMDILAWIYYIIAASGHAALFSLIILICGYLPFIFIFRNNKIAKSVFLFLTICLQTVLVLNSFVFDLYKFHINGIVLELVFGGGATDIFVFDFSLYIKFFVLLILAVILPSILIEVIARKSYQKITSGVVKTISIIFVLFIIISHLGYAVAHALKQSSIQKSSTALPLFFPLTANTLFTKWGLIEPDEIDNLSYNKASSDIQYPLHPITINEDSISNYNILYVFIDSWNPTTFDSIVSPNIYNFSQKGQIFNKHMSSNNGTRGSIFGAFFGLSFTYEKEFDISKMSPLFVDRLIGLGYDIELFPSADFTNPPFHEMLFRRVPDIRTRGKGETPFERDQDITNNFLQFLDNKNDDKPFFSFLFYDLPHAISLPEEYQNNFQPSWTNPNYMDLNNGMDRTPFFNLYKNCVHYTDGLVGEVLRKVKDKGLLENTIIIITGDHGQEFNENHKNYWGHGSNYSKWQIQIPFVIYYPGIESGIVNEHMTTHYDIAPTILNRFMGIGNPSSDYSMGYDLWNNSNRLPHIVGDYVNYAFILDDMILKTSGHTGVLEVTDMELNDIPRNRIDKKELLQAIEAKNKFYK
jgi:membrane-anchored protein YejM (alkaline phosphatase superfamily)